MAQAGLQPPVLKPATRKGWKPCLNSLHAAKKPWVGMLSTGYPSQSILIEQEYQITYLHSYAQDSPWFAGLTNKRLLASRDPESGYTYANPRGHDMYSGRETDWIDITERPARIHAFTVCHFGSEEFLPETPFVLALVEFEGVNTLLLTRLLGVDPMQASLDWIGKSVRPHFLRNSKLKPTDVYFSME